MEFKIINSGIVIPHIVMIGASERIGKGQTEMWEFSVHLSNGMEPCIKSKTKSENEKLHDELIDDVGKYWIATISGKGF